MLLKISFYFLLVLIFLGFESCHIMEGVLKRGSIKMLPVCAVWQLDAECIGSWHFFTFF
jgi:hypothetical protein